MSPKSFTGAGKLPNITVWLEDALASMPPEGRFTLKVPGDLAFGFTDDRQTEKGNQDRLAVAYSLYAGTSGDKWFFAGVCDGVGGEARGELAASVALAQVIAYLSSARGPLETRLAGAIRHAHAEVQQRLGRRSATTFVGVLVNDRGDVAIGSVGDSRAYAVSDVGAVQISTDDTVAEMLRRQSSGASKDTIRETLKALQPHWQESLGQAIGSDMPMTPNMLSRSRPATGEGILLCTDGVWKTVEDLQRVVRTSVGRRDLARRLLTLSDHLGATDNSTAIVIPNVSEVILWLRESNRPSEQGLLHLVLPVEGGVVPISLFGEVAPGNPNPSSGLMASPTPLPTATPTVAEKPAASKTVSVQRTVSEKAAEETPGKGKRRRKSAKTTDAEKQDVRIFQMSIEEGPRDAEPDAPCEVPEDKK